MNSDCLCLLCLLGKEYAIKGCMTRAVQNVTSGNCYERRGGGENVGIRREDRRLVVSEEEVCVGYWSVETQKHNQKGVVWMVTDTEFSCVVAWRKPRAQRERESGGWREHRIHRICRVDDSVAMVLVSYCAMVGMNAADVCIVYERLCES